MLLRSYRLACGLAIIALLQLISVSDLHAQETPSAPELSVAKIKLGDRTSARAFLLPYLPTTGEDGRPTYYFYNKFVDQVLKLTAESFDDAYFITEIEVFAIGQSYQKGHHFLEKTGYFMTENGIFIGYRQSMTAAMIGIPNLARESRIGPNDVVKKKGTPTSRVKEGNQELVTYELAEIVLPDESAETKTNRFGYSARFEFRKNQLKRFVLKISPAQSSGGKF